LRMNEFQPLLEAQICVNVHLTTSWGLNRCLGFMRIQKLACTPAARSSG